MDRYYIYRPATWRGYQVESVRQEHEKEGQGYDDYLARLMEFDEDE